MGEPRNRQLSAAMTFMLMASLLACRLEPPPQESGVSVVIDSPASGTAVMAGERVQIISTASAEAGVARVDLSVDGTLVRSDQPPGGQPTTFAIAQPWTPGEAGEVTVSVVAYDAEGTPSEPAVIVLSVQAGAAEVTSSPEDTPIPENTTAPTAEVLEPFFGDRWVCEVGSSGVALLLDPALVEGIRAGLDRFEADLCAAGYAVVERLSDMHTPPEVRAYLADLYSATGGSLVGTILIGDLPRAYQLVTLTYTNPDIPPSSEEVISFQYYSDLDGIFEFSPGYVSPGGNAYSYDLHSGDMDWEIWVGVLPLYKGDQAQTIDAINRYFERNHAYRAGQHTAPRAFMYITEHHSAVTSEEHDQLLARLTTGEYSWTPFSDAPDALFYFDSTATGLTAAQGYADMSDGLADFVVADAHGYWGGHGQIDVAWIEANSVNTAFFWSNGCAVGNLDHADNFLASVLYSPTSIVLVAKGTTNNSGGMGTNENGFFGRNIATAMSQGQSLGQAVLSHVNVPLLWPWSESREFHFGTNVILGDPTLGLRP